MEKGSLARIDGLAKRADLNGKFGAIGNFHAANGRYEVTPLNLEFPRPSEGSETDGRIEPVLIKQSNLEEIPLVVLMPCHCDHEPDPSVFAERVRSLLSLGHQTRMPGVRPQIIISLSAENEEVEQFQNSMAHILEKQDNMRVTVVTTGTQQFSKLEHIKNALESPAVPEDAWVFFQGDNGSLSGTTRLFWLVKWIWELDSRGANAGGGITADNENAPTNIIWSPSGIAATPEAELPQELDWGNVMRAAKKHKRGYITSNTAREKFMKGSRDIQL